MTRAGIINAVRRFFPHPAAGARRVEADRARKAAEAKAARERALSLYVAGLMKTARNTDGATQ